MNEKQPEALRLADALMEPIVLDKHAMKAAAELRRLHEVAGDRMRRIEKLKIVNAKLLDALKHIKATGVFVDATLQAMMDESIDKAEGK